MDADGIAGPATLALLQQVAAANKPDVSGATSGNVGTGGSAPGGLVCRKGEVPHNGECYDPDVLDGSKDLWGGKSVVECADEATRKAVKKILDEEKAAGKAKQGAKQLGKKLATVPGIFKCMLWD